MDALMQYVDGDLSGMGLLPQQELTSLGSESSINTDELTGSVGCNATSALLDRLNTQAVEVITERSNFLPLGSELQRSSIRSSVPTFRKSNVTDVSASAQRFHPTSADIAPSWNTPNQVTAATSAPTASLYRSSQHVKNPSSEYFQNISLDHIEDTSPPILHQSIPSRGDHNINMVDTSSPASHIRASGLVGGLSPRYRSELGNQKLFDGSKATVFTGEQQLSAGFRNSKSQFLSSPEEVNKTFQDGNLSTSRHIPEVNHFVDKSFSDVRKLRITRSTTAMDTVNVAMRSLLDEIQEVIPEDLQVNTHHTSEGSPLQGKTSAADELKNYLPTTEDYSHDVYSEVMNSSPKKISHQILSTTVTNSMSPSLDKVTYSPLVSRSVAADREMTSPYSPQTNIRNNQSIATAAATSLISVPTSTVCYSSDQARALHVRTQKILGVEQSSLKSNEGNLLSTDDRDNYQILGTASLLPTASHGVRYYGTKGLQETDLNTSSATDAPGVLSDNRYSHGIVGHTMKVVDTRKETLELEGLREELNRLKISNMQPPGHPQGNQTSEGSEMERLRVELKNLKKESISATVHKIPTSLAISKESPETMEISELRQTQASGNSSVVNPPHHLPNNNILLQRESRNFEGKPLEFNHITSMISSSEVQELAALREELKALRKEESYPTPSHTSHHMRVATQSPEARELIKLREELEALKKEGSSLSQLPLKRHHVEENSQIIAVSSLRSQIRESEVLPTLRSEEVVSKKPNSEKMGSLSVGNRVTEKMMPLAKGYSYTPIIMKDKGESNTSAVSLKVDEIERDSNQGRSSLAMRPPRVGQNLNSSAAVLPSAEFSDGIVTASSGKSQQVRLRVEDNSETMNSLLQGLENMKAREDRLLQLCSVVPDNEHSSNRIQSPLVIDNDQLDSTDSSFEHPMVLEGDMGSKQEAVFANNYHQNVAATTINTAVANLQSEVRDLKKTAEAGFGNAAFGNYNIQSQTGQKCVVVDRSSLSNNTSVPSATDKVTSQNQTTPTYSEIEVFKQILVNNSSLSTNSNGGGQQEIRPPYAEVLSETEKLKQRYSRDAHPPPTEKDSNLNKDSMPLGMSNKYHEITEFKEVLQAHCNATEKSKFQSDNNLVKTFVSDLQNNEISELRNDIQLLKETAREVTRVDDVFAVSSTGDDQHEEYHHQNNKITSLQNELNQLRNEIKESNNQQHDISEAERLHCELRELRELIQTAGKESSYSDTADKIFPKEGSVPKQQRSLTSERLSPPRAAPSSDTIDLINHRHHMSGKERSSSRSVKGLEGSTDHDLHNNNTRINDIQQEDESYRRTSSSRVDNIQKSVDREGDVEQIPTITKTTHSHIPSKISPRPPLPSESSLPSELESLQDDLMALKASISNSQVVRYSELDSLKDDFKIGNNKKVSVSVVNDSTHSLQEELTALKTAATNSETPVSQFIKVNNSNTAATRSSNSELASVGERVSEVMNFEYSPNSCNISDIKVMSSENEESYSKLIPVNTNSAVSQSSEFRSTTVVRNSDLNIKQMNLTNLSNVGKGKERTAVSVDSENMFFERTAPSEDNKTSISRFDFDVSNTPQVSEIRKASIPQNSELSALLNDLTALKEAAVEHIRVL